MAEPLLLLGIRREDDGTITIIDPTQAEHMAEGPTGIGKIVMRLLADPEIPRSNPEAIERNAVVDVAARVARRVAPEKSGLIELLEPLAHIASNKLAAEAAKRPGRRTGRRRRASNRM